MSLLPLIGLIISLTFLIGMVTWNFTDIPYQLGVMMGFLLTVFMLCWLIYRYIDWRDDVFQLTPTQVIDIDRKPFGRLSRRSAPLENILSIEYERKGIFQMLFNFGTVYITVAIPSLLSMRSLAQGMCSNKFLSAWVRMPKNCDSGRLTKNVSA